MAVGMDGSAVIRRPWLTPLSHSSSSERKNVINARVGILAVRHRKPFDFHELTSDVLNGRYFPVQNLSEFAGRSAGLPRKSSPRFREPLRSFANP